MPCRPKAENEATNQKVANREVPNNMVINSTGTVRLSISRTTTKDNEDNSAARNVPNTALESYGSGYVKLVVSTTKSGFSRLPLPKNYKQVVDRLHAVS